MLRQVVEVRAVVTLAPGIAPWAMGGSTLLSRLLIWRIYHDYYNHWAPACL
jgi:hypothetical protein